MTGTWDARPEYTPGEIVQYRNQRAYWPARILRCGPKWVTIAIPGMPYLSPRRVPRTSLYAYAKAMEEHQAHQLVAEIEATPGWQCMGVIRDTFTGLWSVSARRDNTPPGQHFEFSSVDMWKRARLRASVTGVTPDPAA